MLTVLESINLSSIYLEKKGIESARTNAELLLAHILNCKRIDLYLKFDRPLQENEITNYREILKRRGEREPLQYIIGSVEFFGLKFKVNPSVLIPRPETELLVEHLIEYVKKYGAKRILDIGTGSGNIAISLAKNLPDSEINSMDNSEEALTVAKENAILNDVRINFHKKDIQNGFDENKFDIIVSNPPYISLNDFENLQPELKVYEPKNALTDYSDGLSLYRIISEKAKNLLSANGRIFLEIGQGQSEEVKEILLSNGFINIQVKKDYQNTDRIITGEFELQAHPPLEET